MSTSISSAGAVLAHNNLAVAEGGLRILHVVPRIADQSSGPSVSVPSLCRAVSPLVGYVKLMALDPKPEHPIYPATHFPCVSFPFAHRLGVSPALRRSLLAAAVEADLIHNHSLWMMPNIYPWKAAKVGGCGLIVSPRGTMSDTALRRGRLRKWCMWRLGQRRVLADARCIHVTSIDELQFVRDAGFRNPIALIPNGVSCPELPSRNPTQQSRILLYLARIHPIKGVDLLLEAWKACSDEFPEWNLKIVGPLGSQYSNQMQKLGATLPRVSFVGELNGVAKAAAYTDADLYVLPSHSENFGISIAEALGHGVPAIVTKGAPWPGLTQRNCGWWIDVGLDPLVAGLREALSRPRNVLSDMGRNGHEWMREEFDWNVIGQKMATVYSWVCNNRSRPEFVYD